LEGDHSFERKERRGARYEGRTGRSNLSVFGAAKLEKGKRKDFRARISGVQGSPEREGRVQVSVTERIKKTTRKKGERLLELGVQTHN